MKNRNYINNLELHTKTEGNVQKLELIKDVLQDGTFLPKPLLHKNYDEEFKRWVEEDLRIVSDDGVVLPTMTLFSNQRFSEYSQSWQYVDDNKNLILNFKTITREPNPKDGTIQNGLWNIPGEQWFLMKKQLVLDDNGTESLLSLKMKQPLAIDFNYKLSIFTTKYEKINEFNQKVNQKFASHQCYIWPNNHPVPMVLDNITDESSYQIDDRQFYCQTYKIKVMGYLIPEDFYKVEESPIKCSVNIGNLPDLKKTLADVEIEDNDENAILTITFQGKSYISKFTNDTDFIVKPNEENSITYTNMFDGFRLFINDDEISLKNDVIFFKNGDKIKIVANKIRKNISSILIINGSK